MTGASDGERKLRLAHFLVQPVLVWDDGNELTPGPTIEPQTMTHAELRKLADGWVEQLREIERVALESSR